MGKRKSRPYLMRGAPVPTEARPTVLDRPDTRVPPVSVPKMSPKEIEGIVKKLDRRLEPINRCFERWAATPNQSGGPGLACVIILRRDDAGTVPLDDLESKIVDGVVRTSPGWARNFVNLWYRSDATVVQMAEALRLKRREYVYDEHKLVLGYYLGRLTEVGPLLNLTV